jgi:molybdopterin-containing oxidoreductase family membrane subunit
MDTAKRKKELVKEFSPTIEKYSNLVKVWMGFLVLIILVGFYAFYLQVTEGHEITGMRDNVVWGIYIINFVFFVGISYSGAFFSGILHYYKSPWKNAVSRIIEIMTVLSLVIGPIFILLCIGRLDRLHYLFLYPRIQSPIAWDIIAIMTDLVGCFIYLYLTFIPDMAILRDSKELRVPNWQKKVYKFLAMGYEDTPHQREVIHKLIRSMSIMIILLALVAYSVLAWIFSLTIQPGWNSTIFAPYFIIAGLLSGVGVIIILMYLIREIFNLKKYIRRIHFFASGIILLILSILFGYFTFTDYFAKWFSHKPDDINLLNTLFNRYFWEFIFANYVGVLIPVIILTIRKFRTPIGVTIAAIIAVLGLWLNRYLIVVPTLETPFLPIQDTRIEFIQYSATWIEYALSFTGIAAFCLFFTLLVKFVPIIPISGIIENEELELSQNEIYQKH